MESIDLDLTYPKSVRNAIRQGKWTKQTSGICSGYLQANMVIMGSKRAKDFKKFCRANPQPCPLLTVLPSGETEAKELAPGSNVTTDLPKYRIYKNGILVNEVTDIKSFWTDDLVTWTDDLVTFLIGCSFSFEGHLIKNGIPVRNVEQDKTVSMFKTSRLCVPSGPFSACSLVVSYRPVPAELVQTA